MRITTLDHIFNFTCWLERHLIITPRNFVEAIYPEKGYAIVQSIRYCLNGIADGLMLYYCKIWWSGDNWPEFHWMTKEAYEQNIEDWKVYGDD